MERPSPDQPPEPDSDAGPLMPPAPQERASLVQSDAQGSFPGSPQTPASGAPLPPPPVARQIAQLVVIPAVIAVIAIALFWLFGRLASTGDSIEDQLARIQRNAGYSSDSLAGAQDPRYRDGILAARQLIATIEDVTSDDERRAITQSLITILRDHVNPKNQELQYVLIRALGRLAQPGGLDTVLTYAESPYELVRTAVIGAILNWTERDLKGARAALPVVVAMLADRYEEIRTTAAGAVRLLATPEDGYAIAALKEAMGSIGVDPTGRPFQNTVAAAAISLAILGDSQGAVYVADTLLNRDALSRMRADMTGKTDATMNANEQELVIAGTLSSISRVTDERVWAKVKELSEKDPSVAIRKAALQLLEGREGGRK